MRPLRFIVLLLGLSFIATSGFATEPRSAARPVPLRSARLDTLAQSFLKNLWSAAGCFIDPLGRCAPTPTTDSGCILDPLGRCTTRPTTDSGCILDPLGRCII